jgi:hypothetical protein
MGRLTIRAKWMGVGGFLRTRKKFTTTYFNYYYSSFFLTIELSLFFQKLFKKAISTTNGGNCGTIGSNIDPFATVIEPAYFSSDCSIKRKFICERLQCIFFFK